MANMLSMKLDLQNLQNKKDENSADITAIQIARENKRKKLRL